MFVRNSDMAGQTRMLRYAGTAAVGDEDGVFDVSDKDGEFLCATPGWNQVKAKKAPEPAPAAPNPAAATKPSEAPAEAPESPAEDDEEPEGPDLEAMTKSQLLDVANEYEVVVDPTARKADILAVLDEAIYGKD